MLPQLSLILLIPRESLAQSFTCYHVSLGQTVGARESLAHSFTCYHVSLGQTVGARESLAHSFTCYHVSLGQTEALTFTPTEATLVARRSLLCV